MSKKSFGADCRSKMFILANSMQGAVADQGRGDHSTSVSLPQQMVLVVH
jgi:hypothetical protein